MKLKLNLGPSLCWAAGLVTSGVCLALVLYLVVKGAGVINPEFLFTDPQPSLQEALSGGILAPIAGSVILTVISIIIAFPLALGTAIYLAEYTENTSPVQLLRGGIDVLAGVPTIVFAIFGVAVFSLPQLGFLSTMVEGVDVQRAFGRSFLVAGIVMALMVLPYVIKSMEEAIKAVPQSFRQAAYSLGATHWSTIRRVVLPAARNGLVTGTVLGIGRIIGDTAIVWLCLGGSMRMTGSEQWWVPGNWWATLRNTGSTLTSYIYYSSPAGEGNSPNKAFGAALVLIIIILVLNFTVDYFSRRGEVEE